MEGYHEKKQALFVQGSVNDVFSSTAKTAELNRDLEVMSQTFERVVDRKDAIIHSLAKDLEEAEEQYQVALRNHIHRVDDVMGKCRLLANSH